MSWWAVGAAAVGVVSAVVSGSNQQKAAKKAANASQAATDASVQIAREGRDAAREALQPYSDAGQDALLAIREMLGLPATTAQSRAQDQQQQQIADGPSEEELMQMFPQHAANWRRWEAAGNSRTNGHRTTFGDFAGYVAAEAGDYEQQLAAWRAEQDANAYDASDYEAYVRANPDLLEAYESGSNADLGGQASGVSIAEFGRRHYMAAGKNEGRAIGAAATTQAAPNETPAQTPSGYGASFYSRLVDDAKASFEDSPWWEFAQQESEQAINDLDAKYGASGLMLSGQGVRARAEIAARLKGEAFDKHYNQQLGAKTDYMSSLYGLLSQGQQAASGIGSGGQAFANTATQALTNNARVQADAALAAGAAQQEAWSDAAGFGGWALGQIGQRTTKTPTTPTPTPEIVS